MDLLNLFAFVALVATVVFLVRGIISMIRGGEAHQQASILLMFRRVEFQAAAATLVIATILFAGVWISEPSSSSDRLAVDLGVMPAHTLRDRYGSESPEAKAYGGVSEAADSYLVTVALAERGSNQRIENASVTATVGRLGLGGTSRRLHPAAFANALTYGNYFIMRKPGSYQIDLAIERPGIEGTDIIRLEYERP